MRHEGCPVVGDHPNVPLQMVEAMATCVAGDAAAMSSYPETRSAFAEMSLIRRGRGRGAGEYEPTPLVEFKLQPCAR